MVTRHVVARVRVLVTSVARVLVAVAAVTTIRVVVAVVEFVRNLLMQAGVELSGAASMARSDLHHHGPHRQLAFRPKSDRISSIHLIAVGRPLQLHPVA